jgi:hypothetical protein
METEPGRRRLCRTRIPNQSCGWKSRPICWKQAWPEIRWQANRHLWFRGDYGISYVGRFLEETQPGRNLNHWALWADYRFCNRNLMDSL